MSPHDKNPPAQKPGPASKRGARKHRKSSNLGELPPLMQVAIDGGSHITRRPIGELVAQSLGALLVDTGRFYRSLTMSCLEAGIDLDDAEAVGEHCGKARLNVWVRRENEPFDEAYAFVNGDLFNKEELAGVWADTWKIARAPSAREQVRAAVLKLGATPRIVVLGRDIISQVLPSTPFKFHIDAPSSIPDPEFRVKNAGPCFYYSSGNADNPGRFMDVFFVSINSMSLDKACNRILAEMVTQFQRYQEK